MFITYVILSDRKQLEIMDREYFEVTERWQRLLIEVGSVHKSLECTIEHWKRYNACNDILTVWITTAEKEIRQANKQVGTRVVLILQAYICLVIHYWMRSA